MLGARGVSAVDAYRGLYRIEELRREAARTFSAVDLMVVPTSPSIYPISKVLAEPRSLNTQLGYYTNFANLLDLAALAVPAGFRADGLPVGITLIGKSASDAQLAALGEAFHRATGGLLGATGKTYATFNPPRAPAAATANDSKRIRVAVVGAHLSGLPLNYQLREAGAALVSACRTAPKYRLYALPNTSPPKPGMVRVAEGGSALELEVWAMPAAAFGRFVALIPSPLCIGSIELEDGSSVHGFLCESHAITNAQDISRYGGWRGYLRASAPTAS